MLFVPMTMQKAVIPGDRLGDRGTSWLQVYGRLQPDATFDRAQAGLSVAGARLASAYPSDNEGRSLRAGPLVTGRRQRTAHARDDDLMVGRRARAADRLREPRRAAAGALGRTAARDGGAPRGRRQPGTLVRQLLIENLMVAAAGGAAGLLIARWTSGMLALFVPPTPYPIGFHASLSLRVVGFSIALTAVTAIVSGLLPALRGSQSDVAVALKEAAPASVGGGRGRLRQGLVVAQVALSLLLLVGAALFLRSLARAQSMDVGYSARQGFMASMDLLAGGYDQERGLAFYQQALARISTLPGVTHASVATALPLDISSGSDTNVDVEGYVPRKDEPMHAYYNRVGPDYFETLGVDIVEGRGITARDIADQPRVVVINETMAKRYFQGRSAIGGTLRFGSGPATVVGVARDGKYSQLTEAPRNYMYMAILQSYRPEGILLVRTANEPAGTLAAVQRELRALDREPSAVRRPDDGRTPAGRPFHPEDGVARCSDSSACWR